MKNIFQIIFLAFLPLVAKTEKARNSSIKRKAIVLCKNELYYAPNTVLFIPHPRSIWFIQFKIGWGRNCVNNCVHGKRSFVWCISQYYVISCYRRLGWWWTLQTRIHVRCNPCAMNLDVMLNLNVRRCLDGWMTAFYFVGILANKRLYFVI